MSNRVTVHFVLDTVPTMSRHRVSVSTSEGMLLSGPSNEIPDVVGVVEGETLIVEVSVPVETRANQTPKRVEQAWTLRACSDAHTVLTLGKATGHRQLPIIEIRVQGAERVTRAAALSA